MAELYEICFEDGRGDGGAHSSQLSGFFADGRTRGGSPGIFG